jgi:hypothetical protein
MRKVFLLNKKTIQLEKLCSIWLTSPQVFKLILILTKEVSKFSSTTNQIIFKMVRQSVISHNI